MNISEVIQINVYVNMVFIKGAYCYKTANLKLITELNFVITRKGVKNDLLQVSILDIALLY